MTRKCSVESCKSDSNRKEDAGVTFHKVPLHPDLRPKWLSLCKIPEDKKNIKIIYVCSRHFLRADFCNFKGRKYMLKQGVLPSVFPWDKSKLEAIKSEVQVKKEVDPPKEQPVRKARKVKKEVVVTDEKPLTSTITESSAGTEMKRELEEVPPLEIKQEIKEELKTNFDEQLRIAQDSSTDISASNSMINFVIDSKIEVLDNHSWYAANINEVDYDENEVLIRFENAPNKSDEWISMTSSRLRPVQEKVVESFQSVLKIEVLDEHSWYAANIIEVDYDKNEVLIRFEHAANRGDEWISMKSSRLRPIQENVVESFQSVSKALEATQTPATHTKANESAPILQPQKPMPIKLEEKFEFEVGERVMAAWSDSRKFPATIGKRLENGAYEVLFDDGYIKAVKPNRIIKVNPAAKIEGKASQSSPLFDPVSSTKQERRDKKRKINVAELFQKRPKLSYDRKSRDSKDSPSRGPSTPSIHSTDGSATASPMMSPPQLVPETPLVTPNLSDTFTAITEGETNKHTPWYPSWNNGIPVGEESRIETADGLKKSVTVADPRMPTGWAKHLCQRTTGLSMGKWDVIFKAPDNRRFRCRNEIKNYLELHPEIDATINNFDFSLYGKSGRKPKIQKKSMEKVIEEPPPVLEKIAEPPKREPPAEVDTGFNLKILHDNGVYKCPLEGCGKQFRRENLALMHVKHYHSEYSKYLESMPNVADLAYARTVGESLDTSPVVPQKAVSTRSSVDKSTPKTTRVAPPPPIIQSETPSEEPVDETQDPDAANKDAEIIRILNKAMLEEAESQQVKKESPKPEIKLKDLLSKPSEIPHKDDSYLRNLSSVIKTPTIKTLLPVRSAKSTPEMKQDTPKPTLRSELKRKLCYLDSKETPRSKHHVSENQLTQPETAASPTMQELPKVSSMEPMQTGFDGVIIENGKIIRLERMKQEEIINCLCGFTEEDGLMIQCELCLCWQHAYCNNIAKETEVPEKYICFICQNPLLERRSCKYLHDQEWLKHGTLPSTSFHLKDKEALMRRFEKLKKCHNISGGLFELREYLHTLGIKLKIAESKNHPKLYLWSKPWDKPKLPEKAMVKEEENSEEKAKIETGDHQTDLPNDSILSMILKAGKEDTMLNMANNMGPIIPQAEAAIDMDDCRLNVLDHISHSSSLIEERLDDFERQLDELERGVINPDLDESSVKTKQTIQLLLRDLDRLKQFSEVPMT